VTVSSRDPATGDNFRRSTSQFVGELRSLFILLHSSLLTRKLPICCVDPPLPLDVAGCEPANLPPQSSDCENIRQMFGLESSHHCIPCCRKAQTSVLMVIVSFPIASSQNQ
jgi:hypothetical protein